ncbi:MAG: DedA family protein [Spirochaetia bacterium]|nr:DedA family protein [Spirochaetia bacterium]
MEYIKSAIDFILHIDLYISFLIEQFGAITYYILFAIIFCETGLIVTPFLPGDSFLFTVGAFSANGDFNVVWVTLLLITAAILGDSVNYAIGKKIGPKIFHYEKSRFFKKENLMKAHVFYEKYGAKTIIIARFVPIVRTFAPFVAGIGDMSYRKFLVYNVVGGILWVVLFIGAGYFFGNLEIVKQNFTLVIFAIIIVSLLPGLIEYIQVKRENRRSLKAR